MKRMPLLLSLLAVIALSASIAYWVLQLYRPQQRPISVPPPQSLPEPSPDAAATLFGGQVVTAVASNYQLTGVVASGREGVAILVADGQPPKAVRVGREIAPGVQLTEVYPRYVMLSEGGIPKRIELATDATAGTDLTPPGGPQPGPPMPMPGQPMPGQPAPPPQMPPPQMVQPAPMPAPMPQPSGSPEPEAVPEPAPVEGPQDGAPPPGQPLPPGVSPSPPGVRMPMPNRNFMPNPPSSQ